MNTETQDHHQSLTLGLGFSSSSTTHKITTNHPGSKPHAVVHDHHHEPSLTLSLSGGGEIYRKDKAAGVAEEAPCSVVSAAASSLTHAVVSVKRERPEISSSDELLDVERGGSSRVSDEDEDGNGPTSTTRKKLRLTKEQSLFLEESFKQQSTLNPKQKQGLADRLNLRARQVEVWFQNRRARTKLKQTEVDCEYLKKCCETLTDENRKLQRELQELKALKMAQPFYMHLPSPTLSMCPSCERIASGTPSTTSSSHFYNPSPNCALLVHK